MKDFLIGVWYLILTLCVLYGIAWLFVEAIRLFVTG